MSVWKTFRREFARAFAVTPAGTPALTPEDHALLEKIALLLVKRGMAAPALLFLESLEPLTFLGSQVAHGLRPLLELICDPVEMERLATLLERRDSVRRLAALIEQHTATCP